MRMYDPFRRLWRLSMLLLALAPRAGFGADHPAIERPIMMDSNGPGTELYVLDESGVLHEFHVMENGLQEYGRVSAPSDFVAADMSFLQSKAPASVLIAGTQSGRGLVMRLSLASSVVQTWGFQNVCSGVDTGSSGDTAYVATSDSNEIYRVDTQKAHTTFIAHIPDASKLGPVAFDEERQEIYVADVASGQVYQYSIATRTSKVLVTHLSAPTALAFDAETRQLFIADPGQRAIYTVDARAPKPAAVLFAPDPLKAPYGLTLLSEGRVAVADYGADSILVFSGKGALLFRYPAAR
jgi:sugar lactone lactonase YvrE